MFDFRRSWMLEIFGFQVGACLGKGWLGWRPIEHRNCSDWGSLGVCSWLAENDDGINYSAAQVNLLAAGISSSDTSFRPDHEEINQTDFLRLSAACTVWWYIYIYIYTTVSLKVHGLSQIPLSRVTKWCIFFNLILLGSLTSYISVAVLGSHLSKSH